MNKLIASCVTKFMFSCLQVVINFVYQCCYQIGIRAETKFADNGSGSCPIYEKPKYINPI